MVQMFKNLFTLNYYYTPNLQGIFFASNIIFFLFNMGTTYKENKYIDYSIEEKWTGFTYIFFTQFRS